MVSLQAYQTQDHFCHCTPTRKYGLVRWTSATTICNLYASFVFSRGGWMSPEERQGAATLQRRKLPRTSIQLTVGHPVSGPSMSQQGTQLPQ